MYLCNCKAITDLQIRQLVEQGVRTLGGVSAYFGVGNECGKCIHDLGKFLDACLATPLPVAVDAPLPVAVDAPLPVAVDAPLPLVDAAPPRAVEEPPQRAAWFAIDL